MGIGLNCFAGLVEFSSRFTTTERSLMLGRQEFRLKTRLQTVSYQRALDRFRPGESVATFRQADGYCETMFARLGFSGIEAMDASNYQFDAVRGGILHDLNQPVPEALHGQYGFIFDGGTLEHVFNVPVAFENVFRMLAPGGRLFAINPLNGWPGHGMYQFTAELVYGFWQRMAGCKVLACRAAGWHGGYRRDIPDPAITGRRTSFWTWTSPLRLVPTGRILLQYEVEKSEGARLDRFAQQSDYAATWARQGATG
jgi:hypothetical protein